MPATAQQTQHAVSGDAYDNDCRLQVVVPRGWKWSSLPDHCHRLPAININETPTFKALVDRCWEVACEEVCIWSCCFKCVSVRLAPGEMSQWS